MKSKNATKIAQLKAELAKLEKEDADYAAMSEDKKIADALHSKFCHHNHTDACGWFYDKGDWTEYSRKEYIDKAHTLMRFCKENNIEAEKIINLITAIRGY